jgi:hypothetical protein
MPFDNLDPHGNVRRALNRVRDIGRAAKQKLCDAIKPLTDNKRVECLCFAFAMLDIVPIPGIGNNPAIEGIDCLCNSRATLGTGCQKGLGAGAAYGATTVVDCLSSVMGCGVGAAVGGVIGAAAGGFGMVPGAIIGCQIGNLTSAVLADPLVDVAMSAIQNKISQGSYLPNEQICACAEVIVEFFG